MRTSSFGYLLKQGAKNIISNRLMSFASIGVLMACLLLIGSSILLSMNVNSIVGYIENQNEIVVFIDDYADEDAISTLEQEIKGLDNVSNITFISKDDVLEQQKESLGDAAILLEDLEENPFPSSFTVGLKDLSMVEDTISKIQNLDNVLEIRAQLDLAHTLTEIKNVVTTAGTAVIAILAVVSIVIIANTIKLTVFNRRKEINIMKYVGATDTFIRLPFIIEGILIGLIAALISFGLLWGGYTYVISWITSNPTTWFQSVVENMIVFKDVALILGGSFALAGSLIGGLGSMIFVRKHLKV